MAAAPTTACAFNRIALVLQGGGALGSYQAGVYQALHEAGLEPDWLAGVSIGAINGAIIAGNRPERRVERLHAFWDRITSRRAWPFAAEGNALRKARNVQSALTTVALGTPGFFTPHPVNPWLAPRGSDAATAFYNTGPLEETLRELVEWDLLAEPGGHPRLAVGAVSVTSGNFEYFDSATRRLGPEHVMASGALPPGFPAVRIKGEHYWDGGLVSNTPLQHLLDDEADRSDALVFQVDLFPARGPLPQDMEEVLGREKDIRFSSRTRMITDMFRRRRDWELRLKDVLTRLPAELRTERDLADLAALQELPQLTILQMVYQAKSYEGQAKDYEFGPETMREHWRAGYEDTQRTLDRKEWLQLPSEDAGVVTRDIHRD